MAVEDFTTYTEVDAGTYLTIASAKTQWTDLPRSSTNYCYKDKGANHFAGDFEFLFEEYCTSGGNGGLAYYLVLANSVADWYAIDTGGGSAIGLDQYGDVGTPFYGALGELDSGNFYQDYDESFATGTLYYSVFSRDEAVGTYGTIYRKAYSDAARTNLVFDETVALHTSKKDFRYIYSVSTYNDGTNGGRIISGYIQNLDLQEAAATSSWRDSLQIYSSTKSGKGGVGGSMPSTPCSII